MPGEIEVTDQMLIAAMRAFEPMALGLRHKEADPGGWHASDLAAMRAAIEAIAPLISRAAYERGQRDMREKAAAIVDGSVLQECCGYGQNSPPECCGCPNIVFDDPANTAASIRALPTGGENG